MKKDYYNTPELASLLWKPLFDASPGAKRVYFSADGELNNYPIEYIPDYDLDFLKESQAYLSAEYAKDADSWGVMKDSVWDGYTDFMYENGLISKKITAGEQYTNEFLK